jgi:NAD-dependent DNA ligase
LPHYNWSKFVTCSSTDYLIVGEEPGSKFKKAEALGVKRISYGEMLKLIEGKVR